MSDSRRAALEGFPVVIEVPLAWGDMDAFQHVNNTVYFRWFESARIAYFRRVGYGSLEESAGLGPILASTSCRFRIPLAYPDTVSVGTRVPEIGEDRFVMEYVAVSHHHAKVAARGEGVIVSFDYTRQAKCALPDAVRRAIVELEGPAGRGAG
jgi:acyl-CoA thioester hydrolase